MCTLCLDLLSNDNATFCFSGGGGQVAGAGEVVGGPGGGVVDNNTGQPAQQQQAKIQFNRSNSLGANHQGGGTYHHAGVLETHFTFLITSYCFRWPGCDG